MGSELWQRIRAARKYAGMSQQQLADACGVSREAVSQWEAADPAKRNTPGFPRLRVISASTGTPYEWLASDESALELHDWAGSEEAIEPPTPDPDILDIPVFSRRNANRIEEPRSLVDQPIGSLLFRRKSLERKGISTQHAEVHYSPDDSMLPTVRRGAAVLFDGSENTILDGRMYVIDWGGQEQIRRLYRELDGSLRVVATNEGAGFPTRLVKTDEPGFRILGRVRWIGSWED